MRGPMSTLTEPPLLTVAPTDDLAGWAGAHRAELRAAVAEHGSLLVRGLNLPDAAAVDGLFDWLVDGLMTEREGFAPRTRYTRGVYSSSAWPPTQPMCMHHELSYADTVPGLMLFACLTAPEQGGATALADAAAVLQQLPADLVARFEREGWLLVRNYNDDIGASIADAFGTDDPATVGRYCQAHGIELEWLPGGGLRTRQRRRAVVVHPASGVRCWFNQVAFLSQWTLAEEVREFLVEEYGADGLPFDTRFGNGDPIDPAIVDTINSLYDDLTVRTPWQDGDLMLVDNLRTAHSREPFQGDREILVGMAEPVRLPAWGEPR